MSCFTQERIAELNTGGKLTPDEEQHINQCDDCLELCLLNPWGWGEEYKPEPPALIWRDDLGMWMPNKDGLLV